MPTVPVIIPTFNRKSLLLEAVGSVFSHTYRGNEVVVIADGSTDVTREALSPYGDRIRDIFQTNSGEASARNCGIQLTETEYVAFLDSDDLWELPSLETTMAHLHVNPSLCLVSTSWVIVPKGARRPRIRKRVLQGEL